jgi:hypothetical protein
MPVNEQGWGTRTKAEIFADVEIAPDTKPKKLARNTYSYTHKDGSYRVRLHVTDIYIKHLDGFEILDHGVFQTVTTKDRINRFTPYTIHQAKGIWTVYGPTGSGIVAAWDEKHFFIPSSYEQSLMPDQALIEYNKKVTKRMISKHRKCRKLATKTVEAFIRDGNVIAKAQVEAAFDRLGIATENITFNLRFIELSKNRFVKAVTKMFYETETGISRSR